MIMGTFFPQYDSFLYKGFQKPIFFLVAIHVQVFISMFLNIDAQPYILALPVNLDWGSMPAIGLGKHLSRLS